jgi:hypothetical protein
MGTGRSPNSQINPTWQRYRQAFENFREKVRNVQNLTLLKDRNQVTIDAAVLEMEIAKEGYNSARDALFSEMVPHANGHIFHSENVPSEKEVRELAELLWELEGRPEGSALDDWYRAESIYRRSSRTFV